MRRVALACLVATIVSTASPDNARASDEPSAADRTTARSLMDRGFDHRKNGQLEESLQAFRAAHDIMRVATTGLELAKTLSLMGRFVEARAVADDVARTAPRPGERPPIKAARAAAASLVADLDAKIARLTVKLRDFPADATVTIDGRALPKWDDEVPIDPGKHTVRAESDGRADGQDIDVAPGERRTVVLSRPAPLAPPKVVVAPRPAPAPRSLVVPITLGAVAGAALAAGAVTGIVTLNGASDLKARCPGATCSPSTFDDAAFQSDLDRNRTWGTVSTVSFVVGGVVLAAAGVWLLMTRPSEPASAAMTRGAPYLVR